MSQTDHTAVGIRRISRRTALVTLLFTFMLAILASLSPYATERAYAYEAGASLLQNTPGDSLQVSIPDLYALTFPGGSREGCEYKIEKIEGNTIDGVGLDFLFDGNQIDKTSKTKIDRYTGMLTLVEAGHAPSNSPDNSAEKFEVTVTVKIISKANDTHFTFPFKVGFKPSASYFALASEDGVYDGQPQAGCVATSGDNGDDPNQCWASMDQSDTDRWVGPYVFTYQGINGTTYGPTAVQPTNAGEYQVTIALPNVVPYYSDLKLGMPAEGWTDTYKGIGSKSFDFTITPKELTSLTLDSNDPSATKPYDGTANFTGVKLNAVGLLDVDKDRVSITASGSMESGAINAGSTAMLAIDNISMDPKEIGDNYFFNPANVTSGKVSIVKAAAFALNTAATVPDSSGYETSLDLAATTGFPTNPHGATYGVTSYTSNGLKSATVDPSTGKLTLKANGKGSGTTDTVTIASASASRRCAR